MTKVLLARVGSPPVNLFSYERFLAKFFYSFYIKPFRPYSLFVLARKLKNAGHICEILDLMCFIKLQRKSIMKNFAAHYDIIGFSFNTNGYYEALKMAEVCKKINPKLKIVFGGPHATFQYFEILKDYKFVDYIAIGEGEKVIVDLANKKDPSAIKGIAYRKNGNVERTSLENIDIDSLEPIDALESVKIFKSSLMSYEVKHFIETSRGCPVGCFFCPIKGFYRQMRFRDAKKVVQDMKILINKGVRDIFVPDPNLSVSPRHVEEICKEMKKNKIYFRSLLCQLHVDFTTKKMLKMLKEAGFTEVLFGIESLSPKVLRNIYKSKNPEAYISRAINLLKYAKAIGLYTIAAYIVPLPGQHEEDVFEEIKLLKKLSTEVDLNFLTPYPGTVYWQQCKNKIKIVDTICSGNLYPIFYLSNLPYKYFKKVYEFTYPFNRRLKSFLNQFRHRTVF